MGTLGSGDHSARTTVGLVVHPTRPVDVSVDRIVRWGSEHGVHVVVRQSDAERAAGAQPVPDEVFADVVDGVVSLGGDGTMLGAMRLSMPRRVPVLGVNHGNLGFLVEVTPDELSDALARLVTEEVTLEPHACLDVTSDDVELATTAGFNDLVLARLGRQGLASVDLSVNGQDYGYYRCDALVVSTATGSTAYNFAAGGPVVSPSAQVVVVTPVAPTAGISRAVVLGPDDHVRLRVAPDSAELGVEVDGTPAATLHAGQVVEATLREDAARVVRLSAGQHASRSRVRLSLLDLPLRSDQLLDLVPERVRERVVELRDEAEREG
ncbi:NAD(+)/NADH kinase [Angustibacter aerolatus]